MSISNINSSPMLQWLQQSLSTAGLTVGTQSSSASNEAQSGSNTIPPFQQAIQMLTSQPAQLTDPQQSLNANGAQGTHHHHHRHHHGGESNNKGFIDQLAQSIVNDLQQTEGIGASSTTDSSSASNGSGMLFMDGLVSVIANNLLTKYQPATDSRQASSPSTQVSAIA